MTENRTKTEERPKTRGGKILPALCSVLGTLILVAVILSALPMAVPRLMGYAVYSVVSGSMEPALPVGSAVFVKETDPAGLTAGDIVAFSDSGTVVTHRVTENWKESRELITKGDANPTEDIFPTAYVNVLGQVKGHVPVIGNLMMLYATREGKLAMALFAACGLLFRLTGSWIRQREKRPAEAKNGPAEENPDKEEEGP